MTSTLSLFYKKKHSIPSVDDSGALIKKHGLGKGKRTGASAKASA
jgi:hypothetical protein